MEDARISDTEVLYLCFSEELGQYNQPCPPFLPDMQQKFERESRDNYTKIAAVRFPPLVHGSYSQHHAIFRIYKAPIAHGVLVLVLSQCQPIWYCSSI